MRAEIGHAHRFEGAPEDRAHRRGIGPENRLDASAHKSPFRIMAVRGPGEHRIIETEEAGRPKVLHPCDNDGLDVLADRKEECIDPFAELCPDFVRVLHHQLAIQVDMLQPQRNHCAVAYAGENCEGHHRPVALFDLGRAGHGE